MNEKWGPPDWWESSDPTFWLGSRDMPRYPKGLYAGKCSPARVEEENAEIPGWHVPDFVAKMKEWVAPLTTMRRTRVHLYVWGPSVDLGAKCDAVRMLDGTYHIHVAIAWAGGRADDGDEVGADVWKSVALQVILDRLGRKLKLGPAPRVPLSSEQEEWIAEHGRPAPRIRVTWEEDAQGESRVPEPTGPFDVWELFVGGERRPWPKVRRRWKALSKEEKVNAGAAVRTELDRYFELRDECLSDGAAMDAAEALMMGKEVWEQYLEGPDDQLLNQLGSSDGEWLLDLVQWWEAQTG